MRRVLLLAVLSLCLAAANERVVPEDPFDVLKALAGDWEADLPGFGKITDSIHLVSNGTAIEETIGTPADNEASLYTRDGRRILLTHFCALTPGGHVARLETADLGHGPRKFDFGFRDATNLTDASAPHMRRMQLTINDADHFTEKWIKADHGKDTVFELHFVRR